MNEAGTIRIAFRGRIGGFTLDAACEMPAVGITALFGPSGCGKTTILRCMAGLHRVDDGLCVVDGVTWQDAATFWPAHRRPIGYVFQEASLFPHLSVRRNLLFGAPRRVSSSGDSIVFDDVVQLLGLAGLLDRAPHHLSGGERQRVAVGRALLSQPRLLLMDEPLSALDRPTRDEILPFLERLHERLSLPVVYVSHDMAEVERLADTLVAVRAGRIEAVGPLEAMQSDPALPFALQRDAAVVLDALVEAYDPADGLATLTIGASRLLIPSPALPVGKPRRLRIAASDVSLARAISQDSTILNIIPAVVASATAAGPHEILAVLSLPGGLRLLARVTRRSWERLGLAEGQSVYAQVKSVALAPKDHR